MACGSQQGRTPELVRLLRLEEAVPTLRMADVVEVMATPLTVDFSTQTDTHLVTKLIDKTYEWNEWALRRRVIQLANLRQVSCVRHFSHSTHRCDIFSHQISTRREKGSGESRRTASQV